MAVKNPLGTTTITTTSVPAATETVVATLAGVNPSVGNLVFLYGWVAITTGTLVTAVQIRIRRTGLTGTLVADSGAVTAGVAASAPSIFDINGQDTPGDVNGITYVMTVQTTGAGTNDTVTAVSLIGYPQ